MGISKELNSHVKGSLPDNSAFSGLQSPSSDSSSNSDSMPRKLGEEEFLSDLIESVIRCSLLYSAWCFHPSSTVSGRLAYNLLAIVDNFAASMLDPPSLKAIERHFRKRKKGLIEALYPSLDIINYGNIRYQQQFITTPTSLVANLTVMA